MHATRLRSAARSRWLRTVGPAVATSLLVASAARAQDEPVKPRRISLMYFAPQATKPGARLNYEAAMLFRQPHELLIGATIGGYYDPAGWGFFIFGEGGYRLTLRFGLFFDLRVGIGYNAITKPGPPYMMGESLVPGPTVVSNNLMPLGSGGLGFDFLPATRVPVSLFARAGGFGLYESSQPFTGTWFFESGLAYQLGTGKPRRIELPVPSPPMAEAPPDLDTRAVPVEPVPPAPGTTPAPVAPGAPTPSPAPGGQAEPAPPQPDPTPRIEPAARRR